MPTCHLLFVPSELDSWAAIGWPWSCDLGLVVMGTRQRELAFLLQSGPQKKTARKERPSYKLPQQNTIIMKIPAETKKKGLDLLSHLV